MGSKWMFCLFVLVSLTSLVTGEFNVSEKANVTCYDGISIFTAENKEKPCSFFDFEKVKCEKCYAQGIYKKLAGADSVMFTFGCEVEGMVDNSETVIEGEEYTHICDKDLCNCSDSK
jgi:hypothetical protein